MGQAGAIECGKEEGYTSNSGKKVKFFCKCLLSTSVRTLQLHRSQREVTHVGGALKCFDNFGSNRFFFFLFFQLLRPGGVQSVRICLCLIKGSNFLFVFRPSPPPHSTALVCLIPTLANCPQPPSTSNQQQQASKQASRLYRLSHPISQKNPGPPAGRPARLQLAALGGTASGGVAG